MGQGYIFTGVCDSVHGVGRAWPGGMRARGGVAVGCAWWGGVYVAGRGGVRGRGGLRDMHAPQADTTATT